jgi:hypothetical protein
VIPQSRTDQYKHSFFVQTAVDWNHLDENTVSAEKLKLAQQSSYDVTLQIQTSMYKNIANLPFQDDNHVCYTSEWFL